MSMLDQAAARRIVDLIGAPLAQHAAVKAAWDQGADIQWRYALSGEHDDINQWRDMERDGGYCSHLGGRVTFAPNWLSDEIELRVRPV